MLVTLHQIINTTEKLMVSTQGMAGKHGLVHPFVVIWYIPTKLHSFNSGPDEQTVTRYFKQFINNGTVGNSIK